MKDATFDAFAVPFTFTAASELNATSGPRHIIERSFRTSCASVVQHWSRSNGNHAEEKDAVILVGCRDGSLYTFQAHNLPAPQIPHIVEPPKSKSRVRSSKSSRRNSRSSSPTSPSYPLSPVLAISSAQPHIVSGITTEQVEAPKIFVDFDDETERLKDILKGKNPRDRSSISDPAKTNPPPIPVIELPPPAKRQISSRGHAPSPSPRPVSISIPGSRSSTDSSGSSSLSESIHLSPWTLRSHIIPSHNGEDFAVKSIKLLDKEDYVAVLQASGDLLVYSVDDGACLLRQNATAFLLPDKEPEASSHPCWTELLKVSISDTIIFIAVANIYPTGYHSQADTEETPSESCQCVAFELGFTPTAYLNHLGCWRFEAPAQGVGVYPTADGQISIFSINYNGNFIIHQLSVRPAFAPSSPVSSPPPASKEKPSPSPEHEHGGHHLLPNPFKSIMTRSSEHLPLIGAPKRTPSPGSTTEPRVDVITTQDQGPLLDNSTIVGVSTLVASPTGFRGVAWTQDQLVVFESQESCLALLGKLPVISVRSVEWLQESVFAVFYADRIQVYTIIAAEGAQEASVVVVQTRPLEAVDCSCLFGSEVFTIGSLCGAKLVSSFNLDQRYQSVDTKILWRIDAPDSKSKTPVELTDMLPLDFDHIVQGYSDGRIRNFNIPQLAKAFNGAGLQADAAAHASNRPLPSSLAGLHVVHNPRTKERYFIGGGDDGSIALWSTQTYELLARWTTFITPLQKVVQVPEDKNVALRGCALCVSQDGSVAVIAVDGFHFQYLVPGAFSILERICVGETYVMLMYRNQRARFWHAQTKELWRSASVHKAKELLGQGTWIDMPLESYDGCTPRTVWKTISSVPHGIDSASTLTLDLGTYIGDAIAVTKTISGSIDQVREIYTTLERLRLILAMLITPGLSEDVDSICFGKLNLKPSSALVGLSSHGSTTLFQTSSPRDPWCISPVASASRSLSIISVLRALSLFEEFSTAASTVITFYSTSLADCVGPDYQRPSLGHLAERWLVSSPEIRQSIRILFDETVASLPDEEAIHIAEDWQHYVPSLQPDAEKESTTAALALFICGSIASNKYSLLSVNALTDISKSVLLYLHDEKSTYRVLAIDLCSRGFHVWQNYVNAMDALRSLFDLATTVKKDAISVQNVGAQARLAVISIAENSVPLFVGTMCLDILNPPSMEHRRSVLQILAYLTRKRPHVLQPSLPRLMEAVVKSLDPNSNSNRELVLDAATEIVGYVVKTFPSVDFHGSTQRLAVGTNEGAVIMYDMKIAIRLYVLEAHKLPITAVSFSPDGRRLVSLSLKDSAVLVWKVGSSFTSFFNPGAPPRQGNAGSEPFKTFKFHVGPEAEMTTEDTLKLVHVEWAGDRTVKVRIRATTMSFST